MTDHIVIITGTRPLDEHVVAAIPAEAIVLGVDSGLDLARAAGLRPSGLIGDLDSISDDGLDWAREHATVARHPVDKDQTDTELALAFAGDMTPERLTMVGGGLGRLDHTIAAIGALGAPSLTDIPQLDAWWDGQHVDVFHGPNRSTLHLQPGSVVSLLALHGGCGKVTIRGVRWELEDHDLEPLVGLGVSNEVTAPDGRVEISLSTGVLTVFDHPADPETTPADDPDADPTTTPDADPTTTADPTNLDHDPPADTSATPSPDPHRGPEQ